MPSVGHALQAVARKVLSIQPQRTSKHQKDFAAAGASKVQEATSTLSTADTPESSIPIWLTELPSDDESDDETPQWLMDAAPPRWRTEVAWPDEEGQGGCSVGWKTSTTAVASETATHEAGDDSNSFLDTEWSSEEES
eukprot:CAMPEP_0176150716 /NCGR_PEP_ID=MMETSP0120_2-20121206/76960_1 /TAXON_ID=160619 /ORGANISM="Kryptoperidinium foliaceum, Strain CCMP 1326" /LENGTH=137 /DNA_ID=CAMNT_0017487653 /DNA_START=1 /DNA_END=414 /DNA_ORIENTATION=+